MISAHWGQQRRRGRPAVDMRKEKRPEMYEVLQNMRKSTEAIRKHAQILGRNKNLYFPGQGLKVTPLIKDLKAWGWSSTRGVWQDVLLYLL